MDRKKIACTRHRHTNKNISESEKTETGNCKLLGYLEISKHILTLD